MPQFEASLLNIVPLTSRHAAEMESWEYDGQWSIYNGEELSNIADYWAVLNDAEELVGFYCTGEEARVPGVTADPNLLDIGLGMRPDLVGAGNGREFASAIMTHCRTHYKGVQARAVVQAWNVRSLRLAENMGFRVVGEHPLTQNGETVTYAVLMLDLRN